MPFFYGVHRINNIDGAQTGADMRSMKRVKKRQESLTKSRLGFCELHIFDIIY